MNAITVTRQLVTATVGDTALDGFTLKANEGGGYIVSDGRDSAQADGPTEALETYANFIETYIDDQDAETAAKWQAEIDKALADAAAIA